MAKRSLPEIGAASMADVAFQLLLFFIFATTMNSEMGLFRRLPPPPEDITQIEQEDVKDRNVFVVLVNRENSLLVENAPMDISELREAAKEFIANPKNRSTLPEKISTLVDGFGNVDVTKYHVISLQNDRGTSYETYIAVQNELTAAYNELKNELALQKFNTRYEDFGDEDERKKAIDEIYPLRISEAEPRNIGGN
ncbi:MAG: biopolymer transporter ExbD [Bacteroidales bacterium]|nr:biopolymer transporter ExbD [Bacteroidales bacterium]